MVQGSQDWIDGRKDGAAVPVGHERLGESGNDDDGGLGPDLLESLIDRTQTKEIDDLGALHSLP